MEGSFSHECLSDSKRKTNIRAFVNMLRYKRNSHVANKAQTSAIKYRKKKMNENENYARILWRNMLF
ncbi:CLUMA_CG010375, isoform A [Clunio marinus]|uniref:CLUMA_CG010375, isoform A n=1 Tax=Clunio marinus TaxID=568069 RepID=A0A1J1I9I3_9DIPT|nr:CLUMA_CG010375, isoform A [Clunio marinus]